MLTMNHFNVFYVKNKNPIWIKSLILIHKAIYIYKKCLLKFLF